MISEIACVLLLSVVCVTAQQIALVNQVEPHGSLNVSKASVDSSVPFITVVKVQKVSEEDLKKATFLVQLDATKENVSLSNTITVTPLDGKKLNLTIMSPSENYYGNITLFIFVDDKFEESVVVTTSGTRALIAKRESAMRVTEGKTAEFFCDVRGIGPEEGTLEWLRSDKSPEWTALLPVANIVNASRLNFTKQRRDRDTLQVMFLQNEDGGSYVCRVTNKQEVTEYVYELRVKDRLAALWPFIGIVIEIIILVVAILVYEQRRSKQAKASKEAEKDTLRAGGDQHGGKGDDHGDNDAETRLRAVKA